MQTISTTEPPEVTQAEREANHNSADAISVEVETTYADGLNIRVRATVPVDVYSNDREIEQAGKLFDMLLKRLAIASLADELS